MILDTSTLFDQFIDLQTLHEQVKKSFATEQSIRWFVRRNRELLVERQALILLAGRWKFHPEKFKAVAVEVGSNMALKNIPLGNGVHVDSVPCVGRDRKRAGLSRRKAAHE